jgi:hypothetical protein
MLNFKNFSRINDTGDSSNIMVGVSRSTQSLYTQMCWQVRSWTSVEVFSSWRSANEHQLASKCPSLCECNTTQYRSWGKQNITQTPLPEGSVPTWSKHHPDHCFSLLLCKYNLLIFLGYFHTEHFFLSVIHCLWSWSSVSVPYSIITWV